jgi:hypothetical protein
MTFRKQAKRGKGFSYWNLLADRQRQRVSFLNPSAENKASGDCAVLPANRMKIGNRVAGHPVQEVRV